MSDEVKRYTVQQVHRLYEQGVLRFFVEHADYETLQAEHEALKKRCGELERVLIVSRGDSVAARQRLVGLERLITHRLKRGKCSEREQPEEPPVASVRRD